MTLPSNSFAPLRVARDTWTAEVDKWDHLQSLMSNAMVLDPFGGSGSTLIACEQTDRICRTIELDEKFCDVIVKRYIEQVGSADGVSVQRDGLTYRYDEVAAESSMT